jgi:DNA-binding NarL/FixJ family response regulator
LKHILADANLIVTMEASTADEAVSLVVQHPFDVAVVDPDSDDVTLHAISQLNEVGVDRVLIFTAIADPKVHRHAFELGALGVVLKEQPAETLLHAIRKIHAGEAWLERVQAANLLSAIRRTRDPEEAKIDTLTKREREVITLVGHGLNGQAIGQRLFISEATVRNHLTSILAKLELSNRYELAVYAFRYKLVEFNPAEALPSRGEVSREVRTAARGVAGL